MNICAFQPTNFHFPSPKPPPSSLPPPKLPTPHQLQLKPSPTRTTPTLKLASKIPRWVFVGGASLGLALAILGADGQREAMAFGPEGPLVEEFWDNVRRYGLYALTVSTGAIYAIFQPIVELLKNPITAILVVVVLVGSGYLVSQVVSAMVGITDFSYDYGY